MDIVAVKSGRLAAWGKWFIVEKIGQLVVCSDEACRPVELVLQQ